MKMLDSALWYAETMNFSVIPIKLNKKPFIKWADYQTQKPTIKEIKNWWAKWPKANIGIVTGKISGIDVIDCDSEIGKNEIDGYMPDSSITPISKTPKGWHYYFKYRPGLSNSVRTIPDCDLRTTGGYVVAPPSKNGNGKRYEWEADINETDLADMPEDVFAILEQGSYQLTQSELSSEHIKKDSFYSGVCEVGKNPSATGALQSATKRYITFSQPGRDDTLFHLANHLVKGGMYKATIEEYLRFFGMNCNPPFEERELSLKIKSAFNRSKRRKAGLTEDIKELISATNGDISATYCYNALQCATRTEKSSVRTVLSRLVNEGVLEKSITKAGCYRIIDGSCEPENWQDAVVSNVKIWLPFELDTMLEIPAGSIILFAGSQDAGKSAVLMNIAKQNRHDWNTHYFSSELNSASFKNRMSKFEDVSLDMLSDIKFYQRGHGFEDAVKTGDKELNIIDYLEVHDTFYKVSEYLDNIYKKLNGKGIAVVAIQKDPYKEFGRGGSFVEEKPVLSIALDRGGIATINKFKGEFRDSNPRGKQYKYKILNGSKLIMVQHWHVPVIIK